MQYGINTWVIVNNVENKADKEFEGLRAKITGHIMVKGKPLHTMIFENSFEYGCFFYEELLPA